MREAMMNAEVGDDVLRDDPTVIELENRVAKLFEKESALFFPTGTMCNLAACMTWCTARGSEIILGDRCHIHVYEQGGISHVGGIAAKTLPTQEDGTLKLSDVQEAIRPSNIHFPITQLIAVENTHNVLGGVCLPSEYLQALAAITKAKNIPIHMDGARIWNASVATGETLAQLTRHVDSVSVCLSKGLGAPAGSLLLGPTNFIESARRIRKQLGGGMRQVGILAAAGLVAIEDFHAGMLEKDHQCTKRLSDALRNFSGLRIEPAVVETNIFIVHFAFKQADEVVKLLNTHGIAASARNGSSMRVVLHRDVNDEDVERILRAFESIVASTA